jgi:hypothetical protein
MIQGNYVGDAAHINSLNNNPILNYRTNILYNSFFSDILNEIEVDCRYHTELDIKNILSSFTETYLSVIGLNCQSLNAKFIEINNLINCLTGDGSKVDVLCLNETWIKNFDNFSIPNFNVFYSIREKERGGGSCIYLNSSITANQINDNRLFIPHILEAVAVKFKLNNGFKGILCSLYRPNTHKDLSPANQINSFLLHFQELIDFFESFEIPLIIKGDFNLNLFDSVDINSSATTLLDSCLASGLINIISRATRISEGSAASLIDHVYIKDLISNLLFTGVICNDISDHFATITAFKTGKVKNSPTKAKKKRILSDDNIQVFKNSLSNLSWNEVLALDDADEAYKKFFKIFIQYYNLSFPLIKSCNDKRYIPSNPFMSRALLRCRMKKQDLAGIYKADPSEINRNNYIRYRNTYKTSVRISKKIYYRNKIASARNNHKIIWDTMKECIGIKPKSNRIDHLKHNGETISKDKDIANLLNSYFSSLGSELTNEIPRTEKDFTDFLPPPYRDSFFLSPVSEATMLNYIRSIKPKPSLDDNSISMKLLNRVSEFICKPLAHIYNCSVATGVFPDLMKVSKSIPIYKSGSPSDMDNFRMVSIINQFSKVFEKIMFERLLEFLESNNFFYNLQFGFRKKYSTLHAVTSIINVISKKLNEGKIVLATLFDIRKCFDLINHEKLFKKLENYGIRGFSLKWFKSYFENRKQRVHCNGVTSDNLCSIIIGVLQGSVLGVLLFLIFINDLANVCAILKAFLFADDCTSLTSSESLEDLISISNSELNKLVLWYNSNSLIIHPKKTKSILFYPPRFNLNLNETADGKKLLPIFINLNHNDEFDISKVCRLNLIPNPDESSAKLLGFMLDNRLDLKDHMNYIHKKISKAIFTLRQMKNILNKEHLKLLYFSYIKSYIDYVNPLFCMASASTLNPILLLQKKAIRIICNKGYRDHTSELFKEEKILPIDKMIHYNISLFMYDYRHDNLPIAFDNTWSKNNQIHNYVIRNADDFYLEDVRAMFLKKQPLYYFPTVWNSLPNNLKVIISRKEFKKEIFDHFLNSIE